MSCVDDEEVAIELESCEVSSPVEHAVPTLNNIWDDDKIEKVSKQDDTFSIEMIYF